MTLHIAKNPGPRSKSSTGRNLAQVITKNAFRVSPKIAEAIAPVIREAMIEEVEQVRRAQGIEESPRQQILNVLTYRFQTTSQIGDAAHMENKRAADVMQRLVTLGVVEKDQTAGVTRWRRKP